MNYEFFRKQYDAGWEQRNVHNAATSIPLTILAVLASAASVMMVEYPYKGNAATGFFTLWGLLALSLAGCAFYCVYRSYWGHLYHQLPHAEALFSYQQQLVDYHASNQQTSCWPSHAVKANDDFSYFLCQRLAEATDENTKVNELRATYLHTAVKLIAIGMLFVALEGGFYVYAKASADEKIHQIELHNK